MHKCCCISVYECCNAVHVDATRRGSNTGRGEQGRARFGTDLSGCGQCLGPACLQHARQATDRLTYEALLLFVHKPLYLILCARQHSLQGLVYRLETFGSTSPNDQEWELLSRRDRRKRLPVLGG